MVKKIKNLIIFLICLIVFPSTIKAMDLGYTIDNYDINMKVLEDNTFEITEKIDVFFNENRHGIIRKIPMKNTIYRLDGTVSKNRVSVRDIMVDNRFSNSISNGFMNVKIGDSNKEINGKKSYKISYKYNIGKDPLKGKDELYFNLIGNSWDTIINNVSFKIEMPKKFDENKLGFSIGGIGSTDNDNLGYYVDGNTIYGNLSKKLLPGYGVTVRLELKEGYFKYDDSIKFNDILMLVIPFICLIISIIIWFVFGRDDKTINTVEFYPPNDKNSLEVSYYYNGKALVKDSMTLLIYLANKGYLKIKEIGEDDFEITKLKEYDGNNEAELNFMENLFDAKDIVDKKSFQSASSIIFPFVAAIVNRREKEIIDHRIKYRVIVCILIFITVLTSAIIPALGYLGFGEVILFTLLVLFYTPFYAIIFIKNIPLTGKIFSFCFAIIHSTIFFLVFDLFEVFIYRKIYLIIFIINMIQVILMIFCFSEMEKRNKYGTEMLGKINGFKNFLQTAEKDKLDSMVKKNPDYFYDILPYTYVLGISDKWIEKFESSGFKNPKWYDSKSTFEIKKFNNFVNKSMKNSFATVSSGSSSSSHSSSHSSGGGFSGGGSGGGGGSSW